MKHLFSKRSQEDGQGLVEYALLLVLASAKAQHLPLRRLASSIVARSDHHEIK